MPPKATCQSPLDSTTISVSRSTNSSTALTLPKFSRWIARHSAFRPSKLVGFNVCSARLDQQEQFGIVGHDGLRLIRIALQPHFQRPDASPWTCQYELRK